jgi:hypothetical protein
MSEMQDVHQSSISRIEKRADMHLNALRNIHAVGANCEHPLDTSVDL